MIKKCLFCKQEKQHYAKGYCRSCYERYRRRGAAEYYVKQNKEEKLLKMREYSKRYKNENPEKVKKSQSNYYLNHKKEISEYKKEWYIKNKQKILEKYHNNKIEEI